MPDLVLGVRGGDGVPAERMDRDVLARCWRSCSRGRWYHGIHVSRCRSRARCLRCGHQRYRRAPRAPARPDRGPSRSAGERRYRTDRGSRTPRSDLSAAVMETGGAVSLRSRFWARLRGRERLSGAAAMGYGVIGSPTGSGPVSLGSSPGTPAKASLASHRPLADSAICPQCWPGGTTPRAALSPGGAKRIPALAGGTRAGTLEALWRVRRGACGRPEVVDRGGDLPRAGPFPGPAISYGAGGGGRARGP